MPRREFRYPINEREVYVSENAARAGEEAFGRPADLSERLDANTMSNLSVLRHLSNNVLRDSVEQAVCAWAADEIERLQKENCAWVYAFHATNCEECKAALWRRGPECEHGSKLLAEARKS